MNVPGLQRRACTRCGEIEERETTYEEPGKGRRAVRFIAMNSMEFVLDNGEGGIYTIYNNDAVYWYTNKPLNFKVSTYFTFKYPSYIVKVNGAELEANADGTYSIPAGEGYVGVTIEGAAEDDDNGKLSFWELLIRFFKKIATFFSSIFGGNFGSNNG